jgi:DNA-directed RNA polymerase specialized sigma24 family protein
MLNLGKMHKIPKILSNCSLNFRKFSEVEVTPELLDRVLKLRDPAATNTLAEVLLKTIHAAMKHYEITATVPYDEWTDFRDKTAMHMWEYSVQRYDPEKAAFSTFVFNHVRNAWINWQKSKKREPIDIGVSMETSTEEGAILGETLEDPLSLEFASAIEAKIIYDHLLEHIQDPRHREILDLWIQTDPKARSKEKAAEVAEGYNKSHPDNPPIAAYRVYRLMRDEIRPLVLNLFPEMAASKGYEKDPETSVWVRKRKQEPALIEPPIEEGFEEEEIALLPSPEEEVAPIYRIDPLTGERTKISLNMQKRRVTAAQDVWFNTLMTFLNIELYDKRY